MPDRPQEPNFTTWANDIAARLRAIERIRLADNPDVVLQTFEDGEPLGDTKFVNFGAGVNAVLVGDGFVEVSADSGVLSWDAIVDGSLAASDPDARLFKGIGEALTYLRTTVGLTDRAFVLVRPFSGGYVETANVTAPDNVFLFSNMRTDLLGGTWSLGAFTVTVAQSFVMWNMNVEMHSSSGGVNCAYFAAYNSMIDFSSNSGTKSYATFAHLEGCAIAGLLPTLATNLRMHQCDIAQEVSSSPGGTRLTMRSCQLAAGGGSPWTWTLPQFTDIDVVDTTVIRGVGEVGTMTMAHAATATSVIRIRNTPRGAGTVTLSITGSAIGHYDIEGAFALVTISPVASTPSLLRLSSGNDIDITGPCVIDLGLRGVGGKVLLRGNAICGTISGTASFEIGVAYLQFIGADDCTIVLAVTGSGNTNPPYSFDATSNNNRLLFAGGGAFSVPGTDAGTGNRVLPEGTVPFVTNGHIVEDEGTPLTQRGTMNFVGAGVTTTDAGGKTVVTIPDAYINDSLMDAKGDIITATANDTPVRKAVGADGTALVADAAQADGLKWATPAVLNFAAAATLGTVVGKVEIFDAAGTSLGFLPVYDAIT